MSFLKSKAKEAQALREALAAMGAEAAPEETQRALRALQPHLGAAARQLSDRRMERRSLRLQALGLAGCSILFLALLRLGFQYREVLFASPLRWGAALGICVMALLSVVCLPVLINKKENHQ